MCFSIEASFIASFFLAVVAIASFLKVKSQGVLGSAKLGLIAIPAGFSVQQFCEGFVWLALLNNHVGWLKDLAIYGFIFFAFIFWPVYMPFCIYRLEQNHTVQNFLKIFMTIGLCVAGLLLERVLYFGITAQLASCHIMYQSHATQFSPLLFWLAMGAYLITTVGSTIISTFPGMRLVGILIGIAYLGAYLFYVNFFISVWCFFAAIISLLVYWLMSQKN